MSRRSSERGQSLVLSAIMITVLIGFVGLVVDGGEAAAEQQIVRGAADGAALAGAYAVSKGRTTATATTLAGQVLTAASLPAGDLAMTYLDSTGTPTTISASVLTVRAVITDQHATYFLGALGISRIQLTAIAEAQTGSSGGAACAVCLMAGSGVGLSEASGGMITVSGGSLQVNSNDGASIDLGDDAALTAPAITTAGGVQLASGATISPTPVAGAAITDPLASIPVPSVAGSATDYTAPVGTSALMPGVYGNISVPAGATLTLNPGTFVITTSLDITGGTLKGSGVTVYLGCAAYPRACSAGDTGASISMSSGSLTLSPPVAGTYAGLTVFSDRANTASNTFSGATVNVTGTWYTLLEAINGTNSGDTFSFGQLIIASLITSDDVVFSVNRSSTQSYGSGSGSPGLTL